MTNKIHYGILSTAQIARNMHVPAARKAGNSVVTAISSRKIATAKKWAIELDIPRAYGSYAELLADAEIDAVINPLPNNMHCEWTVKAAEAGKHILCEKPLSVSVAEVQQMIDAAKANGVLLLEGFTQHYTPAMQFIHQVIANGEIGEIRLVRSELTYTISDWENDVRVMADLAGGSLYDAGCYCVNTVRVVMGAEPVSVQAYERVRQPNQVDSLFAGLLRFPNDRIAYFASSMEAPFRFSLEVIGAEGSLETDNLFTGSQVKVMKAGREEVHTFMSVDRFQKQIEHFSDCILEQRSPMFPPEDGRANAAVLAALKQSAREGRAVKIGR